MDTDAPEHAAQPPRPRSHARPPAPRRVRRTRRRPGPPAGPLWRWVYPPLLIGLAIATVFLSATGARLVLDSRDGQVGRSEQDPTKPGYITTVAATPLLLVVHADEEELYGALLVTLGDEDRGGSMVFLSPDTIVSADGSLADIYENDGVYNAQTGEGLRSAISALFRADIDDVVTIDAASLAPLIEPVAPLRYRLAEPVRVTHNGRSTTLLEAGEVGIRTTDEIAAAIETLGTGEEPIERLDRQSAFWLAWVDAVRAHPEGAFPNGSAGTSLRRFIGGLAAGVPVSLHLPTVRFDGAVVANTDVLEGRLAEIVPYPRQQGVRINAALLNGVGDFSFDEVMQRRLVAAGAQIASRGNAEEFDVARTSVAYHDPAIEREAQELAAAIGATVVRFEEKADSEVQVTVTIGADFDPSEPVVTTTAITGAPR